jgi:hypothetical protein
MSSFFGGVLDDFKHVQKKQKSNKKKSRKKTVVKAESTVEAESYFFGNLFSESKTQLAGKEKYQSDNPYQFGLASETYSNALMMKKQPHIPAAPYPPPVPPDARARGGFSPVRVKSLSSITEVCECLRGLNVASLEEMEKQAAKRVAKSEASNSEQKTRTVSTESELSEKEKKEYWKAGTGYGHGGRAVWNAQEYKTRLAREAEEHAAIWESVSRFLTTLHSNEKLGKSMMNAEEAKNLELSSLLPALILELRSSSLLDFNKRLKVFFCHVQIHPGSSSVLNDAPSNRPHSPMF